jgi:uncharacterized protein
MSPQPHASQVEWLPWSPETFARARSERKPVLLSVIAAWSGSCREMDATTYSDTATVALIADRVVAVRVDADQRPDVAERYDLGGLPTTAFLTAEGQLLGGGTYVTAARLTAAIARVTAASMDPAAHAPQRVAPSDETDRCDDTELVRRIFSAFDEENAGFGGAPKFPLTAPVWLALELHAERESPQLIDRAVRTLDAMGWGPLYDEEDGGFFRCCAGANWSDPQPEKLLQVNAALLELLIHAGTLLGHERWFARAVDVVHYINRALASANGAWRVSSCAAPGQQFSDSNATTVSAMLHAAAVFQDEALGKHALDALERVLLCSYKPGQGVARSAAGVRGLLTDQVAMAAANLDAWESTGNIVYRMMAEELMHYALRTMWDEVNGGFFDRDRASVLDPFPDATIKPFVLNCDAAMVLRRLADALNDGAFARRSREALDAISGRAATLGPLAAHYLIARRAVLR